MARKRGPVTFPPVGEPLPSPVVDNHTHFPFGGEDTVELPDGLAPLTIDKQIDRALEAGIVGIIHSGTEVPVLEASVQVAAENPGRIRAALSIHPNEAPKHAGIYEIGPDGLEQAHNPHHAEYSLDAAIAKVADLAAANPGVVVAIGETGMDLFRTADAGEDAQREAFRAHIALAEELNLPMQIHDRDAHAQVVEVLLSEGAPERTVFHCFSGDAELAAILNENGWYASFAGPVSFKSNVHLREALVTMDPSLIMVETDAPFLTPVPYRGYPNASYVVANTVRSMAQTLEKDLAKTCQLLTANTETVYGKFWAE